MSRNLFGVFAVAAVAALAPLQTSVAQEFPNKPIRIVVPYSAGGGTDIVARLIAGKLSDKLGKAFVENRAGAGGNLGSEAVFAADPDGHTLLFAAQGPYVVNKHLFANLNYNPDALTPVSLVVVAHSVLLIHPKVSAKSVSELIAFARANPGKLNYASQGIGTAAHLTAELFKSRAGVDITHVPYKGSGPAVADLLAGNVDMMFGELAFALPHVRAGKLRALAISAEKPVALLPDVPVMSTVLPKFVVNSWWAMSAPPKTPAPIVQRLSAAISDVMKQKDVATRVAELGMVAVGSSPATLSAFMAEERELWGNVIQTAGVKPR